MLSKVLNARDAGRAQPAHFAAVTAGFGSPRRGEVEPGGNEELRAALNQVRRLEAELAGVRREALEAGRQQGELQTRLELNPVLERLNSSLAELTGMRSEIRHLAEKDVVHLSLLIAKRVLHRELTVDSNALTALARVVFERLARAESYRVIVHPRFAESIRSALTGNQLSRVQIETNPAAEQGTLVIHSEEGLIDASIDVQLEEISRGLTDRLSHS